MMNFKRLDVSACAYEWCCVLIALILFFSYLGFTLSRPFHAGFFWMDYMQDDFFYYLKVAQNIASGHGSTFNNIVRTNGYHPLYEGVLVVVSKLTDSPSGVLCFLAMSTFVSSTAILAACTALFRRFQIPLVSAFALALLCTLYALRTLFSGMEVIITIPLILILLLILLRPEWWTRNIWTGLATGLLAALVALSRLDTLILLTLLAVAMLASQSVRSRLVLSSLLGVLIGLLPVAAYFLFNHSEFGTWMPVSGMAKQLKTDLWPSHRTWDSLIWWKPGHALALLPGPLALLFLPFPFMRGKLSTVERNTAAAVMAFPWIYFLVLSCRSDWKIWEWYLYALRPGFCFSIAVLSTLPLIRRILTNRAFSTALLAGVLSAFSLATGWGFQEQALYEASRDIARFEATHHGIYAMGDRSGSVGYLISSPLVQTEGLVMDREFLTNVQQQRPLLDVLRRYNVRYYIASTPGSSYRGDGCLHAVEPSQAGPSSPKMEGIFCEKPVLEIQHDTFRTLIYDLEPNM